MSAASIYAKRKTTNDLNDNQFADQIATYRNSKGETTGMQQQQMEQQQKQYRDIRLPQERLLQSGRGMAIQSDSARRTPSNAPPAATGGGDNRFSAFRTSPGQSAALTNSPDAMRQEAVQRQRLEQQQRQQQLRLANENRFELFYSRSCPASRKQAEHVLQGLESYFPDSFIRKHVVAIDFDDSTSVGQVHEAILKNERYLSLIQADCLLYDKFENYIVLPDHNILKILKNYCQSVAPKPVSPPPTQRAPPQRMAAQQQQRPAHEEPAHEEPAHEEPARKEPRGSAYNIDDDAVPMPPRGMVGFSMLAKQVGADINSPTADVKIVSQVPRRSNALLLAETQDALAALPATNASSVYGKNKGVTLGYGEDTDAITKAFVDRHNASNPLDREISLPRQQKKGGGGKKSDAQITASLSRGSGKTDFQPQHLQGIAEAPFHQEGQEEPPPMARQKRLPLPAAAPTACATQPSGENDQLGVIRQVKVKK